MQFFHGYEDYCEYKVKFVLGEDVDEVHYFQRTKSYRTLYEPVDDQNELDVTIQEYMSKHYDNLVLIV